MSSDLERLRFLLAGLREPAPSQEAERRALVFRMELGKDARREEGRGRPGPQDGS